jgi:hypothetical protein
MCIHEDSYRLPEGMTRIGYDADTQRYTFLDTSGEIYVGAPGEHYGVMRPAGEEDLPLSEPREHVY